MEEETKSQIGMDPLSIDPSSNASSTFLTSSGNMSCPKTQSPAHLTDDSDPNS